MNKQITKIIIHFSIVLGKYYLLELSFHTCTNRFLFQCRLKRTFFRGFPWLVPEIFPLQTVFFQKSLLCNFCYSQHGASCDISLESSSGVDFKYIYFCRSKTFQFYCIESYHICYFPEITSKRTFAVWVNTLFHDYYQK